MTLPLLTALFVSSIAIAVPAIAHAGPAESTARSHQSVPANATGSRRVSGFPGVTIYREEGSDYGPLFAGARAYGLWIPPDHAAGDEAFANLTTIVLRRCGWRRMSMEARLALIDRWLRAGQFDGASLRLDGVLHDSALEVKVEAPDVVADYWLERHYETRGGIRRVVAIAPTVMRIAPDGNALIDPSKHDGPQSR